MLEKHFYTLNDIVKPKGILPIGRSIWLAGVAKGKYPKPIKDRVFGRRHVWRREDLQNFLDSLSN